MSTRKIKQSPKMPAEKRRQQLLQAARQLFIKKGYRGTTTEEIALKAKLTKGALYYHFASKEEILLALLQDTHCRYEEVMERICRPGVSPLEVLTGLFSVHQREDMAEFRNMIDLWVQAIRIPRIKKHMDAYAQETMEAIAESLDPRFGEDKEARRQMTTLIVALYDGLAVRKTLNPRAVDIPKQLQLFEYFQESLATKKQRKGKVGRDSK